MPHFEPSQLIDIKSAENKVQDLMKHPRFAGLIFLNPIFHKFINRFYAIRPRDREGGTLPIMGPNGLAGGHQQRALTLVE